jgi:hypothetical protein
MLQRRLRLPESLIPIMIRTINTKLQLGFLIGEIMIGSRLEFFRVINIFPLCGR